MDDLADLYQQVLLDHYRHPRNFGRPAAADREAEGHNPLCGDRVKVALALDGDTIREIGFEGAGCAISTASASLMTEAVKGKRLEEVHRLFDAFHAAVTGGRRDPSIDLGKLEAFAGVKEFPMRVKCATLAWHTLNAALGGEKASVSTE